MIATHWPVASQNFSCGSGSMHVGSLGSQSVHGAQNDFPAQGE
jgi:hypothetical protein